MSIVPENNQISINFDGEIIYRGMYIFTPSVSVDDNSPKFAVIYFSDENAMNPVGYGDNIHECIGIAERHDSSLFMSPKYPEAFLVGYRYLDVNQEQLLPITRDLEESEKSFYFILDTTLGLGEGTIISLERHGNNMSADIAVKGRRMHLWHIVGHMSDDELVKAGE
jgi:hypothetical protein